MAWNGWCLHSLRILALVVNLMIGSVSNNLTSLKVAYIEVLFLNRKVATTGNGESTE